MAPELTLEFPMAPKLLVNDVNTQVISSVQAHKDIRQALSPEVHQNNLSRPKV